MFLHADSEDSDQTGWMPRLIRVFDGRTLLLVSSCRGSCSLLEFHHDSLQYFYTKREIKVSRKAASISVKQCSELVWNF